MVHMCILLDEMELNVMKLDGYKPWGGGGLDTLGYMQTTIEV